ncbi:hypothetical protein HC026_05230 [Lactobacillus sp. LC28-10]|uniref:Preprotein translocase subunit SecB n=1 Tax=Secundilactobacillus angelensis TaxID=2722706 RepID=A0ABX1KWL6_9LACO|nr:protein-export chaperone SecB [Secundilactobacillus angelensis]MCH5463435.1 protein-export chaperone SecB [Secundilactobacillus angelensis]NLR18328.1 hypothetical protein [Secundilactobacillus angelensis]
MSVLQFDGYKVTSMEYHRNTNFETPKEQITLDPKLKADHEVNDNHISVTLSLTVGSLTKKSIPFQVDCSVVGSFTYNPEEDKSEIGLDGFIRDNTVAILYPYVRAIIATLTTTSNEFPGYIMPTINVRQVLNQQNED